MNLNLVPKYIVFGKSDCTYCKQATQLLGSKGIHYAYIDVMSDDELSTESLNYLQEASVKSLPYILKTDPEAEKQITVIGSYIHLVTELG